ncbi:MAG TPA: hypothetical protein H9899_11700 [Candidatus Sphingomonas excrementigallinarum]|nr:hypothetical protein [Candidatus Sphingomonas excrementigallinarum]
MMFWSTATLPATLVLAGMALPAVPSGKKVEASLPITMAYAPPDICTIKISDQLFTLPKDDAAATTALQEARRTWTSVSIGSEADIPYRCTARVIYVVNQADFQQIDFVALPPPKPKTLKPR